MKLNIFGKLFLVVLLSMVLLLSVVFGSIAWSFRHGFIDYLQAVEAERLMQITTRLEAAFAEHGSWQFLQDNERLWLQVLRGAWSYDAPQHFPPPAPPPPDGPPPDMREMPPDAGRGMEGFPGRHAEPPPIADPLFPFGHLRLLDSAQQQVVGPHFRTHQEVLRTITHDGQTVGWLAIGQNPVVTDKLAKAFLQQQSQTSMLIGSFAFLLAIVTALALARQFVRPIQRLAIGVRTLGQGRYDNRIDVQSQDELGQLAADVNLLALTLQRNEQQRRLWITDVSHELRTPLAILQSEIEALREGLRTPTPERIESLHSEVLALGKLVDDLYQLSLSDIGAMQYRKEPLDITALANHVVETFQNRFAERQLGLQNHIKTQAPAMIMGDAKRITQLLNNLLENSCRYTHAGGLCEVTLHSGPHSVRICVADSAPAVAETELEKIFDRLYRSQQGRRQEPSGAGLGLAICRNIAEAHGGTITAGPSPHGGLEVLIALPLMRS